MPLGAFRLNTLAKTSAVAAASTLDAVSMPSDANYANTSVSFGGSGQNLTLSFWFKGNTDPGQYYRFFSIRESTLNTWITMFRHTSNANIGFSTFNRFRSPNQRWGFNASAPSNIFDDNWHHILAVTDTTSTANTRMYIDGSSRTVTHDYTNSTSAVNWGTYTNIGVGGRADGTIRVPGDYAQLWIDDSYNNDITKFYDTTNNKALDLGTDGTSSGLSQPVIYHYGDTSTFTTNNGTDSYTLSTVGTGTITDATGPEYIP